MISVIKAKALGDDQVPFLRTSKSALKRKGAIR